MQPRVLIIEDFESARELLRIYLSSNGLEVEAAPGGKEGLALYRAARAEQRDYSAIVLDLAMPEMGGFEIAQEIRRDDKETEIVIWSANVDPLGVVRAAVLGITEILPKPCALEQIEETITRVLNRRQIAQETER